jgi:hypothetical protein
MQLPCERKAVPLEKGHVRARSEECSGSLDPATKRIQCGHQELSER